MKILIDMNLSPVWAAYLNEAGFEAEHWSNIGAFTAADSEIMAWASERDYVVLTADLDFGAILAATQANRPSVIQVRSDNLAPHAIGDAVTAAIRQMEAELLQGALVSVDAERARLRVLPIRR
jgi:predicted nuclease of predicted toxin-antitoxin system